jgi:hypothetical protein
MNKCLFIVSLLLISFFSTAQSTLYKASIGSFSKLNYESIKPLCGLGLVSIETVNQLNKVQLFTWATPQSIIDRTKQCSDLGFKDIKFMPLPASTESHYLLVLESKPENVALGYANFKDLADKSKYWFLDANNNVAFCQGLFDSEEKAKSAWKKISDKDRKYQIIKACSNCVQPFQPIQLPLYYTSSKSFMNSTSSMTSVSERPQSRSLAQPQPTNNTDEDYETDSEFIKSHLVALGYFNNQGKSCSNTASAFKLYKESDSLRLYAQKELAAFDKLEAIKKNKKLTKQEQQLEQVLMDINNSPERVVAELSSAGSATADAYMAYILFTQTDNKNQAQDASVMMHQAINKLQHEKKIENSKIDFTNKFYYDNLKLLISHVIEIQHAEFPDLAFPCWLFKKHPIESRQAFKNYLIENESPIATIGNCPGIEEVPEIQMLNYMTQLLKPYGSKKLTDSEFKENKLRTLQFYDAPLVKDLNAKFYEDKIYAFLKKTQSSIASNKNLVSFYHSYMVSFHETNMRLKLYYEGSGFSKEQANLLANKTLWLIVKDVI